MNEELSQHLSSITNYTSSSSSDDEDIIEFINYSTTPRRVRIYRTRENHFQKWDEGEFYDRFRLTKRTAYVVLEQIRDEIKWPTTRNKALTPSQTLLLTLKFLATGDFLLCNGDFIGIHKSTAGKHIWRVLLAIVKLRSKYIAMPTNQNIAEIKKKFYLISKFPNVVGALDCTHIKLESPDRGRRRSRSRNRDRDSNKDRNSRGDRNRSNQTERRSKWDNNDKSMQQQELMQLQNSMMMPGQQNMMQYGNMMPNMQNPMMNPQMDMTNMQHMMPGMNMMPNNMMMMNQQMQIANQHIYFSNGVILPALPGTTTPQRRERPSGCRTIFIGGLPNGISQDNIKEIFLRFGAIDEVKMHKQGVCHVRYEKPESVEQSFFVSGSRIKFHDQMESEATTLFIDYALNREDQGEFERNKRKRSLTPPRVEQFNATTLVTIGEKIKSDNEFVEAAPTLASWLERGFCSKKNANTFYALIQATNNQLRRLFNEKMQIDDEYQSLRTTIRDKFGHIILQFEQVAKILTAAKLQRVSDHFSKQQRRNIEMWLKMTEELDNIRDEFNAIFDEEEIEKGAGKPTVPLEKYEQLKVENENLTYELEGYKNEAHLAKDEAERKFETFKAHFIAQQALQQNKQVYPPLPPPPPMPNLPSENVKPNPPPPLPEDATSSGIEVKASEAKLISLLSAFLMVHPLGATLDYLVSYVKSLSPNVDQSTVLEVLKKYNDVFHRKTTGVGARIENKWCFVIFDGMKME